MAILKEGEKAPDFCLASTPDQKVSLADFAGKFLILAFYPADWSPVCGDELGIFNEFVHQFRKHGAELLGVSVDNVWSHLAFKHARKFQFELLSDFEPKGEVSKRYGAFRDKEGFCERALFLIDPQGVVRWSYLSPVGINPGVDGILDALDRFAPIQKQERAS